MKSYKDILITRMTHIENIPHILQFGITHKNSPNANSNYLAIGDPLIISSRDNKQILNKYLLGDFTPFYFGYRTPTLYVITHGFNSVGYTSSIDIVYCISKVGNILENNLDFVYSDGHAYQGFTRFYEKNEIENILTVIDFNCINTDNWKNHPDPDCKRKMQAEFLVLGDIPISSVEGFVVFNQQAKDKLLNFGTNLRIEVFPKFYF